MVFEGSYGSGVLSARLEEFVEMFFVISDVVCKVQSYVFAFRRFGVLGKCFLLASVGGPVFWGVVCLRASVESLFLPVFSA